jgi:hypothetical protein
MSEVVVKAKLVAKKDGIYTVYVFQNLQNLEYIMCTKLPNWDSGFIDFHVAGFLTYESAIAGSQYYNPKEQKFETYKYTKMYFKSFIEDRKQTKEIIIC